MDLFFDRRSELLAAQAQGHATFAPVAEYLRLPAVSSLETIRRWISGDEPINELQALVRGRGGPRHPFVRGVLVDDTASLRFDLSEGVAVRVYANEFFEVTFGRPVGRLAHAVLDALGDLPVVRVYRETAVPVLAHAEPARDHVVGGETLLMRLFGESNLKDVRRAARDRMSVKGTEPVPFLAMLDEINTVAARAD